MTAGASNRKRLWGVVLLTSVFLIPGCQEHGSENPATGKSALIIVDLQYDFMPGGALPATGGNEIVALINRLQSSFDLVVATQDWHPPDHGSFASVHPGHEAGETIDLNGLEQELWPDHAVQGTRGAELVANLDTSRIARVFRKGTNSAVDSYSGFFDNGRMSDTGLNDYLRSAGVTDVYVVGLALDYCVEYTALDARYLGYDTTVILDATRAVNVEPGDGEAAVREMRSRGIHVTDSGKLRSGESLSLPDGEI